MKILRAAMVAVALVLSSAVLTGCLTTKERIVVRTQYTIVIPPASMYECPVLKDYPKIETLTDGEVAKLLVKLNSNNKTCKASIEAIKKYLAQSKVTIDGKGKN